MQISYIKTNGNGTPKVSPQSFLLKDGSLIDEDFYRLHHGDKPIRFSQVLEKIKDCERQLMNLEEVKVYEKALKFSSEGIHLSWIDPEDICHLTISPCPDKTVHIGPFRDSPWVAPISLFRNQALDELKKLHLYRNPVEVFCRMTVQAIRKDKKRIFAKVGIE